MNILGRWKSSLSSYSAQYIDISYNNMENSSETNDKTIIDFGSLKTELSMISMKKEDVQPFEMTEMKNELENVSIFEQNITKDGKIIPSFGNNYDEALRLKQNVSYPYADTIYTLDEIRTFMTELERSFIDINRDRDAPVKPTYIFRQTQNELMFRGNYYTIKPYSRFDNSKIITEYFNDRIILNCLREPQTQSLTPLQYFESQYVSIIQYFKDRQYDVECLSLKQHIDRFGPKKCHSFRPSAMKHLIEVFKAKKVLDVSAGWGDRLVGTIASNAEAYYAYDPNVQLFEGYTNIIEFFGKDIDYNIEPQPFEVAQVPQKTFDLAIICGPSFDTEIYVDESSEDVKLQSSFGLSERQWYDTKLSVWIEKCYESLIDNGVLCVNIPSGPHNNYVNWLLSDMSNDPKWKRLGTINYLSLSESSSEYSPYEPIFIWEKMIQRSSVQNNKQQSKLKRPYIQDDTRMALNRPAVSFPITFEKVIEDYVYIVNQLIGINVDDIGLMKKKRVEERSKRMSPKNKYKLSNKSLDSVGESNNAEVQTGYVNKNVVVRTYSNDQSGVLKTVEIKTFPDGTSVRLEKNRQGNVNGRVAIYNDEEYKLIETSYSNGVLDGWRYIYNPSPPYQKLASELFENGVPVQQYVYHINKNDDDKDIVKTFSVFDKIGRVVEIKTYDENSQLILSERFTYDEKGNVSETKFHYDKGVLKKSPQKDTTIIENKKFRGQ